MLFGGWLLADIGWLRNDRRGRRFGAGSDSSRGSRAGIDASNWRLGRFRVLGLVFVEAILLAACLSFAVAVAVLLDARAPVAEIEAIEGGWEASILPARGNQFRTRLPGVKTSILVIPIGERWSTPIANLILTLARGSYGGST